MNGQAGNGSRPDLTSRAAAGATIRAGGGCENSLPLDHAPVKETAAKHKTDTPPPEIAAALMARPGSKAHGDEVSYRCLDHDDKHASVSYNTSKGTAFCQVCAKKGWGWRYMAERLGVHITKPSNGLQRTRTATYNYPGCRKLRYTLDPPIDGKAKSFRWQRLVDGQWKYGLAEGQDPGLYRLDDLKAAPLDTWVIVNEGEKAVDLCRSFGLVATCGCQGAGKWRPEWNGAFADRLVIVVADNDSPGSAHADLVAREIGPIAKRVVILDLPGLPEKGDAADFFGQGHDGHDLLEAAELIGRAWEPPPKSREWWEDLIAEQAQEIAQLKAENTRLKAENHLLKQERSQMFAVKRNSALHGLGDVGMAVVFACASARDHGRKDPTGRGYVQILVDGGKKVPAPNGQDDPSANDDWIVPGGGIAQAVGRSSKTASRQIHELAEYGLWDVELRFAPPRPGKESHPNKQLWIRTTGTVADTLATLATLKPDKVQWGGKRAVRCKMHPDADIIERNHTEYICSECGEILDEQTKVSRVKFPNGHLVPSADSPSCPEETRSRPVPNGNSVPYRIPTDLYRTELPFGGNGYPGPNGHLDRSALAEPPQEAD